jgi:enterochelin esterase-like enzyme
MMNQKRILASVMALTLMAWLLAACSASAPTATTPPQTATPTSIPPTATPTPIPPTATPTPQPTEPAAQQTTGEFIDETITSQALAGNLVGDPAERPYVVYVPPSYAEGDKHYPVVYVLHWFTGNERTALHYVDTFYKYMLKKGTVQEMIFVFPNADNAFGGSQYLSSATIGDYETYIARELVAQIDANYRTIPHPDSRGITGCSMGGHGSMHLALTFPDVFGVVASMSGRYDIANDPSIADTAAAFTHVPEDLDDLSYYQRIGISQIAGMISIAAAAAPNPDKPPFYMDMPFEVVDGEGRIVPEVMEKIAAVDVVHDLEAYLQQPLRLHHILLYHGSGDQVIPIESAQSLDQLLTTHGVEHEYVEIKAGHCSYDVTPVLQYLSDHLVGEQP